MNSSFTLWTVNVILGMRANSSWIPNEEDSLYMIEMVLDPDIIAAARVK